MSMAGWMREVLTRRWNMGFDKNTGVNKLANVLSRRMEKEKESPLCLDFGEIQENGSLLTDTFPVPIPKGQYSVLRSLTFGKTGECFTCTSEEPPQHTILIPETMRSITAGDRVLVAWVQNEAVVIDLVKKS